MAPKLYYITVSIPCRMVQMVAKAIGLDLELELIDRKHLKTDEMLELNPQHTVPILVDQDENFTIWDGHAISIYLVGQYAENDSLYPKDDIKKVALINQRLNFGNLVFEKCKAAFEPILMGIQDEITEEIQDQLLEHFGFLELFLKDRQWLAGDDLTIADLSFLALVSTIEEVAFPIDPERFPNLADWLNRAKNLPYFEECNRQGLEKLKGLSQHEEPLI